MPRRKRLVKERLCNLLKYNHTQAEPLTSSSDEPFKNFISINEPPDEDASVSSASHGSVEMLPVDDIQPLELEDFAQKMRTYFMKWSMKMRREKEEGKRAQNYTGKAARTIRHHKQRGKEAAKKNGSTLDNFFLHKQKKAPPERTPTLVNTETSTLAATEVVALEDSSIGWNSNTNEVHINVDPVAIGGELLSNDAESIEEEPEEVLMQAVINSEHQSSSFRDSEATTNDSPDNHVPEVAQHQSPTVLHPNDAEGEDPDDIHQDLWKDHQLMVSVEKRLTQAEREHHNKMEKLLGARLVAMKSLIHFYTSEDYQLTWRQASMMAATGAGKGTWFARRLRQWIMAYIRGNFTYDSLPHTRYGMFKTSLLDDEDLSQRIQQHLQALDRNFKAQDVVDFVTSPAMQGCLGVHRQKIGLRTARRWLKRTHRYGLPEKGMYIDGHERNDVVNYRQLFLQRMEERARRMPIFNTAVGDMSVVMPQLQNGEKLLILVTHDESTFYENDRKHQRWIPLDATAVPQPKGEGVSVMVSDFLSPICGRLKDEISEARIFFHCGKNGDGYFDNDDILKQTNEAIKLFERIYPTAQALFMFDNATTHQKRATDSLSALHMPKSCKIWRPGQPLMRDAILPNGAPQPLYWPVTHQEFPGHFKGMEQILKERGLWRSGLKAQCTTRFADCEDRTNCCCRRILYNQPDFVNQKSSLEELVESKGHLCDFYPKFHCELNFIEQYWGASKFRYRQAPPTDSLAEMEQTMRDCLDDVPLVQIQRYWNRSLRFMDAYRRGLTGKQAI